MSGILGTPRCFVDIYPYEGGKYTLTGGNVGLLSCTVTKSVRSTEPGTFTLLLTPGGPFGLNASPQWFQIITVMSLAVIGIERAGIRQIVMIGVVTSLTTPQEFRPQSNVARTVTIQGYDFQYFFTQRNFYALTFLSSNAGAALGPLGLPAVISDGLVTGTPDVIGANWFNKVMAGANGILAQTDFNYRGSQPTFTDLMASLFEAYPTSANAKIGVAYATYYAAEESWMTKFLKCFPYPWYEFFIMTAPIGFYTESPLPDATINAAEAKTPIDMRGFPAASPTLVARVNPLPWSENQGLAVRTPDLKMNYDRWNALEEFSPDIGGTFTQMLSYSDAEVRNFYVVNPMFNPLPTGQGNANITPFIYRFASWTDPTSIHRYGFRPEIAEIPWLSDPKGLQAQQAAVDNISDDQRNALVANLALRQTSYFEPTPLMCRAQITGDLRPDIIAGNRYTFTPFKDRLPWTFYIDAVGHQYVFGGPSVTTLSLSRGLPAAVYANPDLLLALHLGNAQLRDGLYSKVPTASVSTSISTAQASGTAATTISNTGLQPLNYDSIAALYGQITAQVFQTPGAS